MTTTTISYTISSMTTSTNTTKQRLTLFLKPSVIRHSKATAIVEGMTLTQLVEKALIEYLPEKIVLKKGGESQISKNIKVNKNEE